MIVTVTGGPGAGHESELSWPPGPWHGHECKTRPGGGAADQAPAGLTVRMFRTRPARRSQAAGTPPVGPGVMRAVIPQQPWARTDESAFPNSNQPQRAPPVALSQAAGQVSDTVRLGYGPTRITAGF